MDVLNRSNGNGISRLTALPLGRVSALSGFPRLQLASRLNRSAIPPTPSVHHLRSSYPDSVRSRGSVRLFPVFAGFRGRAEDGQARDRVLVGGIRFRHGDSGAGKSRGGTRCRLLFLPLSTPMTHAPRGYLLYHRDRFINARSPRIVGHGRSL